MVALEKFMNQMELTSNIEVDNAYPTSKRGVCMKIIVTRKGNIEYLQYHCYSLKSNGDLRYDEGNEVKGIHQGVLSYLGMDREIDNYFDNKARVIAKEYLTNREI